MLFINKSAPKTPLALVPGRALHSNVSPAENNRRLYRVYTIVEKNQKAMQNTTSIVSQQGAQGI